MLLLPLADLMLHLHSGEVQKCLKGWVSNSEEEKKEIEINLQQKAVKYLFFITISIKSELERYKATVVL